MPISKASADMDFLKGEMEMMHLELRQVKDCLIGNDFNEGQGLVSQLHDLRNRIDSLEKTFNKYRNIIVGLSIGTGIGVGALAKFIVENFIKH